jgi:hypothetical protein
MGMPYLFEDPHITTGANFVYIIHRFDPDSAFLGGEAHVLALQLRVALTDRLAFIATKDGLTMLRADNPALPEENNIFDMTVGFKYALFESREEDFILTPALRYEIPLGSKVLYQNYGKGVFIPSASFSWGLKRFGLEHAQLIGSLGGQVPAKSARNSRSLFYNIHLNYAFEVDLGVLEHVVPFIELNGMHWTAGGDGMNPIFLAGGGSVPVALLGPFEGYDIANLGNLGIAGRDVVSLGGGVRLPTSWGVSFGLMYEGAVVRQSGAILGQRFTFMATWEL